MDDKDEVWGKSTKVEESDDMCSEIAFVHME